MLDLVVGVAGLLVAIPVVLAARVAMWCTGDLGPLLYRARRVGEAGRTITVLKVRTMYVNSDGPGITRRDDARITRVGRILRHYKLDELPQFINVVRGEMSVVGPRPEDPRYVDARDPLHRFVFAARPGITGPTQIAFRHEEQMLLVSDADAHYRAVVLPAKLAMDAEYLRRRTVRSDLGIMLGTVRAIVDRG